MTTAAPPLETNPAPATPAAPRPGRGMVHSVMHLGLGQVTTTALAIVLNAFVARSLGAADFGLWYLLTTFATFAFVFVDWGFGSYVIRKVARAPERVGELAGTLLAVRALSALLVTLPAVISAWILGYDERTRVFVALTIVASIPMLLALTYSWIFRGNERMDLDALLNVVLKAVTLCATLGGVALGGHITAVILAPAISGTTALVLAALLYRRLALPKMRVSATAARRLIQGAFPFFAGGMAVQLQRYLDANILTQLVSQEVVGWYGAAATFMGTLIAPATILAGAGYPRLSSAAGNQAEFKSLVHDLLRTMLLVAGLGAVGTYMFADFVVGIVYSHGQFGPASSVVRAFAPVLFLMSFDMVLATIVYAAGQVGRFARAKLVAVCVTSVLDVVFIRFFQARFGNGGIGVPVSFALGEVAMIAWACRIIPRGVLDRRTAINGLRAVTAGLGTLAFTPLIAAMPVAFGIPVCVLLYAALAAAVGLLTRSDLRMMLSLMPSPAGQPRGQAPPEQAL